MLRQVKLAHGHLRGTRRDPPSRALARRSSPRVRAGRWLQCAQPLAEKAGNATTGGERHRMS